MPATGEEGFEGRLGGVEESWPPPPVREMVASEKEKLA